MIDALDSTPRPADANTSLRVTVGKTFGVEVAKRGMLFNTRYMSGSSLPRAIHLGFVFSGIALALNAAAGSIREEGTAPDFIGKTRLKSTEITRLFSDVIDRGEAQNERGISAETHWHAGGTLLSRWWTEANPVSDTRGTSDKGAVTREVMGRWRAENDLRCVTFDRGTQPDWSCAEVWLLDDGRILSLNPDGSAHGLHRLSPLK